MALCARCRAVASICIGARFDIMNRTLNVDKMEHTEQRQCVESTVEKSGVGLAKLISIERP